MQKEMGLLFFVLVWFGFGFAFDIGFWKVRMANTALIKNNKKTKKEILHTKQGAEKCKSQMGVMKVEKLLLLPFSILKFIIVSL
jgi:hypothetical protein